MDSVQSSIGRDDSRTISNGVLRQPPEGLRIACLAQQLLQNRIRDAWRNAASQAVYEMRTDFTRRFCILRD